MEEIQKIVAQIKEQLDMITSQAWSRGYDQGFRAGQQALKDGLYDASEHGKAITDDMALAMAHEEAHGKRVESPVNANPEPLQAYNPCPHKVVDRDGGHCGKPEGVACPPGVDADCNLPAPAHGAKRVHTDKDGNRVTVFGDIKKEGV